MIKTDRAVIVEGKYDKIKLNSILDAIIIPTDGFAIFNDKEKQRLIRRLSETRGLLILTDSDTAGFKIRNFIGGIVNPDTVVNAYIPDIFGKEKRKTEPSKEGKLGVEGVSTDIITAALEQCGVLYEENDLLEKKLITKLDFYEDGLTGCRDSALLRKKLLKELSLPERLTTNSLIEILNTFISFDEYKQTVEKIKND